MRRKLNDIDECYIQAHKEDMSTEDLSQKLDVSESSINKYIDSLQEQPKEKQSKPKAKKDTPPVGHYVLTEKDSEIGDESHRRGSTNDWKDRIHRPRG